MKQEQDIEQSVKSPFPLNVQANDLITRVKNGLLLSLYRFEPIVTENKEMTEYNLSINRKIERLYEKIQGTKFNLEIFSNTHYPPILLFGPKGIQEDHREAIYSVACQEICTDLGLQLIKNPEATYIPNMNDFLLVTHSTTEKQPEIIFGGIPSIGVTHTNKSDMRATKTAETVNSKLALLKHSAGGLFLFKNTTSSFYAQENLLFQVLNLKNAYTGFIANTTETNGNHGLSLSNAMSHRVEAVFVSENKHENPVQITRKK